MDGSVGDDRTFVRYLSHEARGGQAARAGGVLQASEGEGKEKITRRSSSVVERFLGKKEVESSILSSGSYRINSTYQCHKIILSV